MANTIEEIMNQLNFITVTVELNSLFPYKEIEKKYKDTPMYQDILKFNMKCKEFKLEKEPLTRLLINELGDVSEHCNLRIGYYANDHEHITLFFYPNVRTDEWMALFKPISTRRQFFDYIHTFKNTRRIILFYDKYYKLLDEKLDLYNKANNYLEKLINSQYNTRNKRNYNNGNLEFSINEQKQKVAKLSKEIEILESFEQKLNVQQSYQYTVPYGKINYKMEKVEIDENYLALKYMNDYKAPSYRVIKFCKGIKFVDSEFSYNEEEFDCLKMVIDNKSYKGPAVKSLKENNNERKISKVVSFLVSKPINCFDINSSCRDVNVYCSNENIKRIKYCTFDPSNKKLLFTEKEIKDCIPDFSNEGKKIYLDTVYSDEEVNELKNIENLSATSYCRANNNLFKHTVEVLYSINCRQIPVYSYTRIVDNFIYNDKQYVILNNGIVINVTDIQMFSLTNCSYFDGLDMDVFHMSKENDGYYLSYNSDYVEYYKNEDIRNYLITILSICNSSYNK